MRQEKYSELFAAFEKAPMESFLELLFEGVPDHVRKRLIIEDVSYHRNSPDTVSLQAWMVIDSPGSHKWIWVRTEMDRTTDCITVKYYTKVTLRKGLSVNSFEECIESYRTESFR